MKRRCHASLRRRQPAPRGTVVLALLVLIAASPVPAAEYPDPERYRAAIDAFAAEAVEAPPPAGAIVATGSSSMRGWHGRIAEDLAPLDIVPRGFGGSNMADVAYFVEELVVRYKPRAVLLYEGDNDVALGATPAQILGHFDAFAAAIHEALPETRIYILAVKPSLARWHLWPTMQTTNAGLAERAAADPRLTFIDVATPMLNEAGEPRPNIFVEDGLHMNGAGYDIWRDAVRPVLLAAEADRQP